MNFLDKIDFMMNKLGINKSKLSAISGVPYTTIDTFYKKGYENTKLSTVKKIAEALDVSMDYLLVDTITDENYGKTNGFLIKSEEMAHIQKYRLIDPEWQEAVDSILEIGYKRHEANRQALTAAEIKAGREQLEAAEQRPTSDDGDGQDELENILIAHVKHMDPGRKQMLLRQIEALTEPQTGPQDFSCSLEVGEKVP